MSSNTEIPLAPLTEFVENALRILVESTDQTAFDNQFNAFFGQNVSVTLNGEKLSRAQYKQQLFGVTFEEQSATINFLSSVAIPFGSVSSNPVSSRRFLHRPLVAVLLFVADANDYPDRTSGLWGYFTRLLSPRNSGF